MANNKQSKQNKETHDNPPTKQPKISQIILIKSFEEKNKDTFYYIPELKCWAVFNENRWELDAYSLLYEKLFETLKEKYPLGTSNDELLIKRSINILKEIRKYRRPSTIFDRRPELLNCQNGVYNLNTGEFIEHGNSLIKDFHITKITNSNYNEKAECPKFKDFIKEIFSTYTACDDIVEYMQRALGYMISGYITNQAFYFFHGGGANGKTTLVETIKNVIGDYSVVFSKNLLTDKKAKITGSIYKELKGRRIINVNEFLSTDVINENTLKQLSGNDTLRVEIDNNLVIEDKLPCKFIGITNKFPKAKDAGYALFRRLQLIIFNRTFCGDNVNPNLIDELKQEKDGILNWLIEGYKAYKNNVILQMPLELKKEAISIRNDISDIKQYGIGGQLVVTDPNFLITAACVGEYLVTLCREDWYNYKLTSAEKSPTRIGQLLTKLSDKTIILQNIKLYCGVGLQNSHTVTITSFFSTIHVNLGDVSFSTNCCTHIDKYIDGLDGYLKSENCQKEFYYKLWLEELIKYRDNLIVQNTYVPFENYCTAKFKQ